MYLFSWIFALFCALILPLGLAAEFCVRRKKSWKPLLFGALTFTAFQGFARLPVLTALSGTAWYASLQASPVWYTLFLGVSAALFEEGGRFLVMRFLLKRQRTVADAVAFGVGHGGIEAVVILGATALFTLISGTGVTETDPVFVFAGAAERLFALTAQIGFSVLMMKSLREKKTGWLIPVFVSHALLGFAIAYSSGYLGSGAEIWAVEAAAGMLAAGMGWFTWMEWKREKAAPKS